MPTNTNAPKFIVGFGKETAKQYHADPCELPALNQTTALILNKKSPLHAWLQHPRLGGKKRVPTAAMNEGKLADSLLFETVGDFEVVDAENYRTKAAQQARDEILGRGVQPVLPHELAEAQSAADAIRVRLALAGLDLMAGKQQVPIYWVETADDGTKVQCRGLLDQLEGLTIRDLKKIKDAAPADLNKHCERYGYDIQAAAYMSGVAQCIPESTGRVKFEWVFIEANEPYAVTRAEPAGSMCALGHARWRRAVNIWAKCLSTGMWPGYEEGGLVRVEASQWALQDLALEDEEYDGQAA